MLLCYYQHINLQVHSLLRLSDSQEMGNCYYDRWTDKYTPIEKTLFSLELRL